MRSSARAARWRRRGARSIAAVHAEIVTLSRRNTNVRPLPMKVEQLTWQFLDMTEEGGRMAIMWGTTMGSVAFTVGR
jgi:hypothetical protein